MAVVTLAMMAFLSGAGREIVKDIMDAKGDEARGSRSLARSRGVGFAARGSGGFFLIAVCLSPLPFVLPSGGTYYMNPLYIVPVALTDLLLCYVAIRSVGIREPSDAVPLRGMSLLALNVGLIGFLLGAF